MQQIRVKLSPTSVSVTPQQGATFTVVTGATVRLERMGSGQLQVPARATNATLEFFEIPKPQGQQGPDIATTPRLIGTLSGQIQIENDAPKFDAGGRFMSSTQLVNGSDFIVLLNFDTGTFENTNQDTNLTLPWEVSEEKRRLEVGVKLNIAGSVHSDIPFNDKLDIPLRHNGVPEDGTSRSVFIECFGVNAVYPSRNSQLGLTQHIPIGNDPIRVFVHTSVGIRCNAIRSGSFNLNNTLRQGITEILRSGGFTNIEVDIDPPVQNVDMIWVRRDLRFIARNVANPNRVFDNEGWDIPFFDYWVFCERNVAPVANEFGLAESLNPSARFNMPHRTKRVITPIVLVEGPFEQNYRDVSPGDRMNYVANCITHEIGHSLGLRHGLTFQPSTKTYLLLRGFALGAMAYMNITVGQPHPLRRFGPVHRDTIQRHFL